MGALRVNKERIFYGSKPQGIIPFSVLFEPDQYFIEGFIHFWDLFYEHQESDTLKMQALLFRVGLYFLCILFVLDVINQ